LGKDAHSAIEKAMGDYWTNPTIEKAKHIVENKLQGIDFTTDNLTKDEAIALLYYTMDGPLHLQVQSSVYTCLSQILVSRGEVTQKIDNWKHYIYLLLQGAFKLPLYNRKVFRGIKCSLSDIYQVNNLVIWITVSSTSEIIDVATKFSSLNSGTMMHIFADEGRQLSKYSFFPEEKEVLILPNTEFRVAERCIPERRAELVQTKKTSKNSLLMIKN